MFFTAYRVRAGGKWKLGLFGKANEEVVPNLSYMERKSCGYLPMQMAGTVLADGLHNVSFDFRALEPTQEQCRRSNLASDSLLLEAIPLPEDTASHDDLEESTTFSNDSVIRDSDCNVSHVTENNSEVVSMNDDSTQVRSTKSKGQKERLSLLVCRIR